MPRRARIDAPGAVQHIIIRGIERRAIFKEDNDRDDFLRRLGNNLIESATSCYAWVLMTNHVHLLLRTGHVPLATVMRRLLTGYAVSFNRRYERHGQLFQNRYKSILCQEDTYLLELTRYIHLNPLRVQVVLDIEALGRYPYCGHSVIMGKHENAWQDTGKILGLFSGVSVSEARMRYCSFVEKGVSAGRREDLVGGGLIRSAGGWQNARATLRGGDRIKGDERILGDSGFVLSVLDRNNEIMEWRQKLRAESMDIEKLVSYVASIFDLEPGQILSPGRYPAIVRARSVLCFWAIRKWGFTATGLAAQIGMTQPAISISARRGEKIVAQMGLDLKGLID